MSESPETDVGHERIAVSCLLTFVDCKHLYHCKLLDLLCRLYFDGPTACVIHQPHYHLQDARFSRLKNKLREKKYGMIQIS